MKKTIYAILLLGLLSLTLTACTKKVGEEGVTEEGAAKETTMEEEKMSSSLRDLMNLGKSVKCTYEFSDDQTSSKGVSYVSEDKTRTEATVVTADGMEMTSYSITDGKTVYTWSSKDNKGLKMTMTEEEPTEDMDVPEAGDNYQYTNFDQKVDYNCSAWIPDNSKFEVPSDVEFTDINAMMEDPMKMLEEMDIPSME